MSLADPLTILVVEDEPSLRKVLDRSLTYAGFRVVAVEGLAQARAVEDEVHLALLDIMLPDGSGLDLAAELRGDDAELPVIFLTAKDSVDDRLTGFALGGDDYVTKPFSIAELIARIRAVLRRSTSEAPEGGSVLEVAGLEIREEAHEVRRDGVELELSPTEYRLLHLLMTHSQQVLSKEQILDHVWGYGDGDTGVVEKFVSQLRRKVDDGRTPLLHTVRGFGYVLRPPKD